MEASWGFTLILAVGSLWFVFSNFNSVSFPKEFIVHVGISFQSFSGFSNERIHPCRAGERSKRGRGACWHGGPQVSLGKWETFSGTLKFYENPFWGPGRNENFFAGKFYRNNLELNSTHRTHNSIMIMVATQGGGVCEREGCSKAFPGMDISFSFLKVILGRGGECVSRWWILMKHSHDECMKPFSRGLEYSFFLINGGSGVKKNTFPGVGKYSWLYCTFGGSPCCWCLPWS